MSGVWYSHSVYVPIKKINQIGASSTLFILSNQFLLPNIQCSSNYSVNTSATYSRDSEIHGCWGPGWCDVFTLCITGCSLISEMCNTGRSTTNDAVSTILYRSDDELIYERIWSSWPYDPTNSSTKIAITWKYNLMETVLPFKIDNFHLPTS